MIKYNSASKRVKDMSNFCWPSVKDQIIVTLAAGVDSE